MTKARFLQRALIADAAISGASGLLLLFGGGVLAPILNLSPELLRYAGASLVPFTVFVAWMCMREQVSRGGAWVVIALNAAWVVASVLLLTTDLVAPSRLGVAFILVQAVAVAIFAEMQYTGLRRATA